MTGEYSTTPIAALQVIEGITPLYIKSQMESILVRVGRLRSYLYRLRLHHSDICACGEKGDTLYYATSCHLFIFTKLRAEHTLIGRKNLLLNKLSRIKMAKLMSFLTDDEDLIKQQPDATSSADYDPDFSPSPIPHTDRPRPSRCPIPRTVIRSSYKFLKAVNFWGLS
ncbi:hypothetical protein AVEN_56050-1 [Araneus ventricosus]|uniref:Uncharacterized protein n=1 Tax=Araneus ventricosus TaxID=182803 RepID=A0A4Y2DLN7_ARAVE|nr:hypothetical protein AVEN_56050-1 [Araneus ventricosus]